MPDLVSIEVVANDLARGVDAPGRSGHRTGKVEASEVRTDCHKCMLRTTSVDVRAGDLAKRIDVVRLGKGCPREIEAGALPLRANEAVLERRSNGRRRPQLGLAICFMSRAPKWSRESHAKVTVLIGRPKRCGYTTNR